ncbi:MAG TPA: flagellar basal body-associated FliL family protein [Pirellulaceae bacterium]|nr:flagellar basal body-associated FliL family protein [Pirellulaceae bacterium]
MRSIATILILVLLLGFLIAGCGEKPRSVAELDASELLALIQDQQHLDPRNHVETDLGRFRITHPLAAGEGQMHVQFQLVAILPQARQERLAELLPPVEKRVRDAVISLVQRSETEYLTDPGLEYFKAEVVRAINRVLQEPLVVDVAFSDFSMDRDDGMPWSVPAPERESKPAGGGQH